MTQAQPDIAALTSSRICHDLISPIGAITNGLELLEMAGATDGPEIGLINDSVNNASARIRFFRLAFGAASDQPVALQEVTSVLHDITAGTRLQIIWDCDVASARTLIRLAFLAEQCLETAMPFGGTITIASDDGDAWHLTGQSDRMKLNTALWEMLADGHVPADLDARDVHFALLALHSRDAGRAVRTDLSETRIDMSF